MTGKELTPYGRAVREMRDKAEVDLFDMADAVGKSISLLSAIELGKKNVTEQVLQKTVNYFNKMGLQGDVLFEKATVANEYFKLNWSAWPEYDKELLHNFSSKFREFTPEQKERLSKLLNGSGSI